MNDQEHDWLDAELKSLDELEAPETLLPKVMAEVRARAGRPWFLRIFDRRSELAPALAIGLALIVLVVSLLTNSFAGALFQGSPAIRGAAVVLESFQTMVIQSRIGSIPLLVLLGILFLSSYLLCIAAAKAVQRLSTVR